jgi:hypothetical protein
MPGRIAHFDFVVFVVLFRPVFGGNRMNMGGITKAMWLRIGLAALSGALMLLVQAGTGVAYERPVLPGQGVGLSLMGDAGTGWRRVTILDVSDGVALPEERFTDAMPDLGNRGGDMGTLQVSPPGMPRVPRQRVADGGDEEGLLAGDLFPGMQRSRERSGWGWLADEVWQSEPFTGAEIEMPEQQRRMSSEDDRGFDFRRWVDE